MTLQIDEKQLAQTIGKAIAKHRKTKGLTQEELAEVLGVGNDAVSRMERGTSMPTVARLVTLAEIFGCGAADLLTESSNRAQDQAQQIHRLISQLNEADRIKLLAIFESIVSLRLQG